jgi:hypothetical protein
LQDGGSVEVPVTSDEGKYFSPHPRKFSADLFGVLRRLALQLLKTLLRERACVRLSSVQQAERDHAFWFMMLSVTPWRVEVMPS